MEKFVPRVFPLFEQRDRNVIYAVIRKNFNAF